MANQLSPLEALSYVQQQGEIGRERGQRNQLAQLYSQTYTAAPEQQSALLGQMAAINPQAAQATQQQFQGQEDRRLQKLAGAARYLEQARQTNNPQAVQGAWNAVRPMLQREMPQGQFPDQWDDATMAPTLYQVLAQTGGSAQGNVQSTYVDDQGQRVAILRDGSTRVLGGNDAGANQQTLTIDIGGVPTQVTFDRRTGRYTTAEIGAQLASPLTQRNGGTVFMGADGVPIDVSQVTDPAVRQSIISQSTGWNSVPDGGSVAMPQRTTGTPLVGRTKEAEAAAVEAAKQAAQLQYLPAMESIKTNAAIQQAGGTAEATNTAKTRAELQATQAERQRNAQDTLGLLDAAEQLLPQATGSRSGQLVDAAAGMFGASTPGAQATAQLQTIAGQLTSKMPRMQGPQSDRDVQLYQQMAGDLANPTIPVETRMAALKTIRQLNQKYANGGAQGGNSGRRVVRTGTLPDGRKVVQYSDGTTDYGN